MDWLDAVLLVILLAAVVRGVELGLIRQLCSAAGFFGGLFLGVWLQGKVVHFAHAANSRALLSLCVILGCAFFLLVIGEHVGNAAKSRLELLRINKADRFLGSFTAALTVLVAIWLGANIFADLPSASWQRQVQQSYVVTRLNSVMPPAPKVIARISNFITPNGFPQVFTGLEPSPKQTEVVTPDMSTLSGVVRQAAPSVVKVEGEGCGGIVDGTGFVARNNLVITNAHVVAGVADPQVLDGNGRHKTTVVWFDPNLDFAVLRVNNLAGKPLPIITQLAPAGTQGTVLGYPGGGAFKADPAAVIDSFTAIGRNIYDQENTTREIYSLKADIIGGNSGGPLLDKGGNVMGIIFAHSTAYEHVGYALTMQQTTDKLTQAEQNRTPVATGSCAE
jgi:S1-C subfamily serine protease